MNTDPEPIQLELPIVPAGLPDSSLTELLKVASEVWEHDAACIGYPPDDWFPLPTEPGTAPMAVCATCPVARECLATALLHQHQGIWGGATDAQRQRIRYYLAAGGSLDDAMTRVLGADDYGCGELGMVA